MPEKTRRPALIRATTAPADTTRQWYDTTYNIQRIWNGYDWVPGVDHILDRAEMVSSYTIPTTATSVATAVAVPGLTVTPTLPAGPARVNAGMIISHGAAGWAAGRFLSVFIGDATVNSAQPVVLGDAAFTHSGVSAGLVHANLDVEFPIAAADAATRTYKVYAYLSSSLLTAAIVFGDPGTVAWIEAGLSV